MLSDVYWVDGVDLAIGPHPIGYEMLHVSCRALREEGIDIVVSAQTDRERRQLGLAAEAEEVEAAGMEFINIPIIDHTPPPFSDEVFEIIESLAQKIREGRRIFIHCYAGIGRSATLAAGVLIELGYTPQQAVQVLSDARGIMVPETLDQREWLLQFSLRHRE